MTHLLSDAELNDISATARDNKFRVSSSDLIYPETSADKLKFFINAYRFVENLINNIPNTDEKYELKMKLKKLLFMNSDKMDSAVRFKMFLNSDVNYGRKRVMDKIELLLNNTQVNLLMDCVMELGRVKKMYNPDDNVGY